MKNILKYTGSIGVLLALFVLSCESKNDSTMENNQTQQFATSNEAVAKGKSDLLELLKTNKNNGLNLDQSLVEQAQPEENIAVADVDFAQLLSVDSISSFRDLQCIEKGRMTPLYANGKLVTTISTRIDNGSWSVSGIKDQFAEAEISEMRNTNLSYTNSEVKLYEIPNIDARVYSVNSNGQEIYYSNYNGLTLSKPIPLNELVLILKRDALEFNRQYGDMLKKDKLVK